ncbi:DNA-binding protein [Amorphoplanes digitatis]|uniref:DNA-binding protein n=1 Tax=Actinoplanes digitatis TaxID=1868 RepID=A0A7W7I417_9ACTN|nr:hypothetical protein [Actinoplanes digitatis]MBB4766033.1 hypothetical protein [Actinoplanes digitatis]BFE76008.1 hypothetical protein GCM10020092_093090 [Actinoplanes digitatis]GID98565.1 hypothetical protein Adi01nite_79770 [Actinoplanes digitatis]
MSQQHTTHLTPAHLALRWSVTAGHLANQRSAGIGPTYLKLGGRILYRLIDIEAYEEQALVAGVSA